MKTNERSSFWSLIQPAILFIAVLMLVGKVLLIFSPIITTYFVLIGTMCGLTGGWVRATLTISGIVMYILSWVGFLNWGWGVNEALCVCGVGIITWIIGVFTSFIAFDDNDHFTKTTQRNVRVLI